MIAPMTASLIAPMASSLIQPVKDNWKVSQKSRKRTGRWISFIFSITFINEKSGKRCNKSRRGYNNMDHMDKNV